ncbi:hypothetical protein [Caulobacter sp. 17J80-11]|uniref:hypothetical protein n=1 Tax=Caulobacter sp. 17J80-11 TaxID=2763502 RepID=UPI001653A938|nr:hypothetical protein [Caulobacter sp. 17J80-11]MBC6983688.1 hypothetical protein [Caulobacter sp. 17J80-11]
MAWSAPSADRPLPNEGLLRYGLAAAALPLYAPFLAAAGAGMAWWWATAWTRAPRSVFAPAAPSARRIEVTSAPQTVSPAPAPKTIEPVLQAPVPPPADVSEVAADVHAVAALETAPLHSDAEAVKAAVADVIAAAKAPRKKPTGPKATV